jgi:hypothetical protein
LVGLRGRSVVVYVCKITPDVFLILKVTFAGMVPVDPKGPQIPTVVEVFTLASQAEKL